MWMGFVGSIATEVSLWAPARFDTFTFVPGTGVDDSPFDPFAGDPAKEPAPDPVTGMVL